MRIQFYRTINHYMLGLYYDFKIYDRIYKNIDKNIDNIDQNINCVWGYLPTNHVGRSQLYFIVIIFNLTDFL